MVSRFAHFVILAVFISVSLLAMPSFAFSPKVPTQKYSQLFIARFYPWFSSVFPIESNLSQKQQQILKRIISTQEDFLQQLQGTYIGTFAAGYLESPGYSGPSLRILRHSRDFDKQIESLTGHKGPALSESPVKLRGFELRSGRINYVTVVEENSNLVKQRYEFKGAVWALTEKINLNQKIEADSPPFLKIHYQADQAQGAIWYHCTGFIDEKYFSITAQKMMLLVRDKFNLDPSLVSYSDNHHFGIYYP
jgi:hypothetical protein